MEENRKGCLRLILGLILLAGFLGLLIYSGQAPKIENPNYAVGTIVDFESNGRTSGDAVVTFKVGNKIYENDEIGVSAYDANIIGEKYKVEYEKGNPSVNTVLVSQPLFLPSEDTQIAMGVITRYYRINWPLNKGSTNYAIDFTYKVGSDVYKKSQCLPYNYMKQYPTLKEGQSYMISYWVKNPNRAIMYLNSPWKDKSAVPKGNRNSK